MRGYTVLLAITSLPQFNAASTINATPPLVTVLNGTYRGVFSQQYTQDYFLGMPYSQPPVDDLRLRAAQSLNTSWTGIKNATEYGPECYGYGRDTWSLGNIVSEDCLSLNVVRPSYFEGTLPVAVWIHVGLMLFDCNSCPNINIGWWLHGRW